VYKNAAFSTNRSL